MYNLSDVRLLQANDGRQLVYDTAPFEQGTEIAGFFRLDAWIAIDRPDTDFRVLIYAVKQDGSSVLLTNDTQRARYRQGLRQARPIDSTEPSPYTFDRFWFAARRLMPGERLRLAFGPFNSIHTQKNYNSRGVVADETRNDARTVHVRVSIGGEHAAVLHVPIARSDDAVAAEVGAQ